MSRARQNSPQREVRVRQAFARDHPTAAAVLDGWEVTPAYLQRDCALIESIVQELSGLEGYDWAGRWLLGEPTADRLNELGGRVGRELWRRYEGPKVECVCDGEGCERALLFRITPVGLCATFVPRDPEPTFEGRPYWDWEPWPSNGNTAEAEPWIIAQCHLHGEWRIRTHPVMAQRRRAIAAGTRRLKLRCTPGSQEVAVAPHPRTAQR